MSRRPNRKMATIYFAAVVRSLLCLAYVLGAVPAVAAAEQGSRPHTVPKASVDPRPIVLLIVDGTDLRFTRPSRTDELSQTKVGQIAQDRNPGFMWFGTQYGLNRFDGYNFKIFVHESGNPKSLSGVLISSLFTARDGTLWVGCDQFLNKFNQVTETFTRYPVPFVTYISQDTSGILWLATGTGLYSLDPATGRIRRYSHDPNDPSSLSSDNVKSSGEDKSGRFWVATTQGLDEFDRRTGKIALHIPVQEPSDVLSFYEDRFGVFWIFQVSRNTLAVFDRKTNTLTPYSFREERSPGTALTGVTAMVEDQTGTLWVSTHGAGLLKFDREHRRFIRYRNNPSVPDSLPQDDVESLFVDREGSIWAGLGSRGLTRFATKPLPFRRLPHNLGDPNSVGNPFIGAIYEDREANLWIGTPDALHRIDQAGNCTSYRRTAGSGARTDAITIREDRSGNLWVGTYGHGLLRLDPRTGEFKTYRHDPANPYSLSDDFVSRLLIDHKGTLWAASSEALNRFDAATERFTSYKPNPQHGSLFYLELVEDRDGILWLGTHSSGLQRFDPATGQFTTDYQHDVDRRGTLSDNRVNSIYFDRAGTMWIGTQNGLDKFAAKTGKFTVFTHRNGLPGNVVGCVLEDDHGNLWMSTNNGVASFDKQTEAVRSYSSADGLPGPDLTGWGACFRSQTGELFFGGFSGAVAFYPAAAMSYPQVSPDDPHAPAVVLTEFRLSGHPVEIGPGSPLSKSISHTTQLTLSQAQSNFSLAFSALSYVTPNTNRYRYKLEGLDEAWHEVGSDERLATYTTVPAGTYTFRLQAATRRGQWSVPGVALRIKILPPIWRTAWFLTVCAALIALSAWMLYIARIKRLAYQFNLRLEERVHERTRIARELHDTLLQSLHGLMLRFQATYNMLPSKPMEAKQALKIAMDCAAEAITESRDAVQELRRRSLGSTDLLQALTALGDEFAATYAANDDGKDAVKYRVVLEGSPRSLQPLLRDDVYRIVREAVGNAFRHARANLIEVEVRYDPRMLRLRARDDGIGIDPRILARGRNDGHWGLPGMRERADAIGVQIDLWSELGSGTEIEIRVPATVAYVKEPTKVSFRSLLQRRSER